MDNFIDKLAERYNAGEMIRANSEAEAANMRNLEEQVEAYEAVLQEMRKLNYKNTELTEKMYCLVDESLEKVHTLQIAASEGGANPELVSREMSDAVTGALNEALNNMDATVAQTISESLAAALVKPTEEIKQTTQVAENVGNKVDNLYQQIDVVKDLASKLNDMISLLQAGVDQNKGLLQTVSLAQEANKETVSILSDSVSVLSGSSADARAKLDEIDKQLADIVNAIGESKNNEVSFDEESKNYIVNIWNSVEQTKSSLAAINEKVDFVANKENEKDANKDLEANKVNEELKEEIKSMVVELTSGNDELKNSVKLLKTSQDETKSSLKSALDSAIYGLKQDNKEMVSFMQRMNTNITTKQNDPDAETKEEEARQREEENKKALEERFKQTEDYMHKESVKVYRNVQAVINEKSDQQTSAIEAKVNANTAKIGQVKAVAIIAALLSGLTLVAQVLSIFGII